MTKAESDTLQSPQRPTPLAGTATRCILSTMVVIGTISIIPGMVCMMLYFYAVVRLQDIPFGSAFNYVLGVSIIGVIIGVCGFFPAQADPAHQAAPPEEVTD